jgi:methylphosphotriester-DNA--protein-cysteine methyltransferase
VKLYEVHFQVMPPSVDLITPTPPIARTCLRDERHTILETALELGFADNTGFHRAFKRWTGLTPTEYRRQQKSLASRA